MSALWTYYVELDKIWFREIDLLKPNSPDRSFPVLLFINAHAKVRVALELAFSGCVPEARSILRDAVEFLAHAHHMLKDSALQKTWLNKNSDEEAFKEQFWHFKETVLFAGLDELYETWKKLSERGSHANINSICERFHSVDVDGQKEWRIAYTGGMDEKTWVMSIFDMLLTMFKMEEALFEDYKLRFQFDEELLKMRGKFELYKERLRAFIIKRYGIKPPEQLVVVV